MGTESIIISALHRIDCHILKKLAGADISILGEKKLRETQLQIHRNLDSVWLLPLNRLEGICMEIHGDVACSFSEHFSQLLS